jgi:hypothetical protein
MFCFFASQDEVCEGRLDRAHLIPAQRLRRNGLDPSDERTWVRACRHHHHQFDHRFIRLPRERLPSEIEEYAAEHGIEWSLTRDYGELP